MLSAMGKLVLRRELALSSKVLYPVGAKVEAEFN